MHSLHVLNVAGYKFVDLQGLDAIRPQLQAQAHAAALKGTILLAPEGINCFLAGEPSSLRDFVDAALRVHPELSDLRVKESWSHEVPSKRLRVKIKREIIRMNDDGVQPSKARAPAVEPARLARWLASGTDDEGRPVVMLDTRNGFEVDAGRFRGALDWRLERFSDFPRALEKHADGLRGATIVSYCTGGIRCEKAAILMQREGLRAFQLEGGVLGYFEQVGQTHYDGTCFVFDERGELDAALQPSR